MNTSSAQTNPNLPAADPRYVAIALLTCVVIVILYIFQKDFGLSPAGPSPSKESETFVSKHDKSTAIYEWWKKNVKNPSYAKYKEDLKLESNIVEYEDVRKKIINGVPLTKGMINSTI